MPNGEPPFTPNTVYSSLLAYPDGMNSGVAPILLPESQLAFASNSTVRGTFIRPRAPWRRIALDFGGSNPGTAFINGLWQDGCFYKPDFGSEALMAAISGRLYRVTPDPINPTATVVDVSPNPANPPANTQAWLWQSENYICWNDGVSLTVFYDGTSSRRSNAPKLQVVKQTGTLSAPFTVAVPVGTDACAGGNSITLTSAFQGQINDIVTIGNTGQLKVLAFAGAIITSALNLNIKPPGFSFGSIIGVSGGGPVSSQVGAGTSYQAGTPVTYFTQSTTIGELPPGRMGVYWMGRNWVCLIDGKQFIASDIVGGSSGTVANNLRDAVLKISENSYLAGGGNFTVPGSIGSIQAMIGMADLDKALGQGPLMVFTDTAVFTCQTPVIRTDWQDVTNPILSVAMIGSGATGQFSTVQVNSDIVFRAIVGLYSFILGRRDFATWGNVPISREVERITDLDDENLLPFGSAIVFDNRLIMTVRPTAVANHGVYHKGLVTLNLDPISTLRGKAPSVYDGQWPGLNALKLIVGKFNGQERAFAFTFNPQLQEIELWELLKSKTTHIYDNDNTPIIWWFETPVLKWKGEDPKTPAFKRLLDGELAVDELFGRVDFQVYYKPDQYACWIPWFQWSECAGADTDAKRQYRHRMGFGEPSGNICDETVNKPFREAYRFQVKVVVRGQCRIVSMRFKAITLPEQTFAGPACSPLCQDVVETVPFEVSGPIFRVTDDIGFRVTDMGDFRIVV